MNLVFSEMVSLDGESIYQLTSPTWFNWLEFGVTLVGFILANFGIWWFWFNYSRGRLRQIVPNRSKFQYTLAKNQQQRELLVILGDISLQLGYGQYGDVGRREQLLPVYTVSYRTFKSKALEKEIVSTEWFTAYWDDYFVEEDVISVDIVYLIQTSLLVHYTSSVSLTVFKKYYSIAFDWQQELAYNEESKYLHRTTLEELLKLLEYVGVSKETGNVLVLIYEAHYESTANHKHVLWQQLMYQS